MFFVDKRGSKEYEDFDKGQICAQTDAGSGNS